MSTEGVLLSLTRLLLWHSMAELSKYVATLLVLFLVSAKEYQDSNDYSYKLG